MLDWTERRLFINKWAGALPSNRENLDDLQYWKLRFFLSREVHYTIR
jgi:hypothetical protein